MSTKINVIVSENRVWATYHKTICFTAGFTDEESKAAAIKDAHASAFGYALGFSSVLCNQHEYKGLTNLRDKDIFELLERIG